MTSTALMLWLACGAVALVAMALHDLGWSPLVSRWFAAVMVLLGPIALGLAVYYLIGIGRREGGR